MGRWPLSKFDFEEPDISEYEKSFTVKSLI